MPRQRHEARVRRVRQQSSLDGGWLQQHPQCLEVVEQAIDPFGPKAKVGADQYLSVFGDDLCAEDGLQDQLFNRGQNLRWLASRIDAGHHQHIGVNDRLSCAHEFPFVRRRFRR